MTVVGKYVFIGTSKIRETSKSFEKLPVKNENNQAGILIFNTESEKIEGKIIYEEVVNEIYDVVHIPFFENTFMLTKDDEMQLLIL